MVPRLAEEAVGSVHGDQAAAQTTATTVMPQNQTNATAAVNFANICGPPSGGGEPCLSPGLEGGKDS